MKPATAASALKVQAALGPKFTVLEFEASTRSAAEAAAAIGCSVAQIAKSLIFRTVESDKPVLVIMSGASRVDEARLAAAIGEAVSRGSAEFVRDKTGYAIGGVPPVAHVTPITTFIDESILAFAEIWAAAGTPNAVFKLTPADLVRLTGGKVLALAQESA